MTICAGMCSRTLSWSATASGSPIGSRRQKPSPYARIVSAMSWPIVRVSGGSGGGRSRIGEHLEQRRQRSTQGVERVLDAPEAAVRLADGVRDRTKLERRDAGERSSAQDAESLHRLHLA